MLVMGTQVDIFTFFDGIVWLTRTEKRVLQN